MAGSPSRAALGHKELKSRKMRSPRAPSWDWAFQGEGTPCSEVVWLRGAPCIRETKTDSVWQRAGNRKGTVGETGGYGEVRLDRARMAECRI